ncbi:hypothetical protein PMIN01_13389 [Paraphaeosphaeria minitans]|uniref:Uncharacterized protein n=1 Tax=Paraphaeosphaeria minitans TaxID=565426 RepID=A0A9P6KJH7_9PLEO|nr:hypothetical protein PMIN01_13389 [Paraphaeosphaeria minitans]
MIWIRSENSVKKLIRWRPVGPANSSRLDYSMRGVLRDQLPGRAQGRGPMRLSRNALINRPVGPENNTNNQSK